MIGVDLDIDAADHHSASMLPLVTDRFWSIAPYDQRRPRMALRFSGAAQSAAALANICLTSSCSADSCADPALRAGRLW